MSLPSTSITPVTGPTTRARPTTSPTTCRRSARRWKSKIGVGVNANWPGGQGGSGSRGVAGIVSNTQGAIGYVDVAFALTNKLKFMSMRNASGKFTTPGLRGIRPLRHGQEGAGEQRAAHRQPAEVGSARLPDLHVHVRDPADEDAKNAADLRKFVFYAINPTQGQKLGPKLLFAPLPKTVLVASEKTLKKVQS